MHAASVNPEPGSNSLKNVYLNPFRNLNPFSELLFNLASFYFLSFSQCVLTRTTLFQCFLCFLLFNFQWSSCLQGCKLFYYTTIFPFCQYIFLTFFVFFYFYSNCPINFHIFHIIFSQNSDTIITESKRTSPKGWIP